VRKGASLAGNPAAHVLPPSTLFLLSLSLVRSRSADVTFRWIPTRKAEGEADGAAGASDKGEKKQDKKQKKSKYDILVPIAQAGLVQRLTDFYGLGTEFPSDQVRWGVCV
jgi:hypothetical protein